MPQPAPDELLVAVRACGVCRTDLHVAEGDLPVHRPGVIPGHEVVGEVVALAADAGATNSRSVIASASHGCVTPAASASSASAAQENLCPAVAVHRLGRRRWIRRIRHCPSRFRPPSARRIFRYRTGPAAVCGHHRLSLAAAGRPAGRRPTRDLRLRRQRALTAQVALAQGAEVHVMTRGAARPRTGAGAGRGVSAGRRPIARR